ncbi:alpha/beta hydrolase [Streptomyces sp. MUM 203J]|uniref:alpha/beta hydrolase n=1 Tax=Streptomyces sp. MUM 203J TaxID=2791990 RepID=UPI001F03345C|nr:alpha/beta hydrolase [Streptomyces sp. MUM 203J]MCH0542108.1 alpha/beta hydrolase [Streptomyces sp. MUM 203J]
MTVTPTPHLTSLTLRPDGAAPRAVVLLLHGGRANALTPPPRANLPALRMLPFAAAIRRATRGSGVAIGAVRYRHRGWNGTRADAAKDAARALAELEGLAGPVPVVLVGHSMGGRAALRVAGDPRVRGVVALAPWCPPDEPVAHLVGKPLFLLHDEADRVIEARSTWAFVRRATQAGALAHALPMPGGGHAMLAGARAWHRTTAALVAGVLDAEPGSPPPLLLPPRPRSG